MVEIENKMGNQIPDEIGAEIGDHRDSVQDRFERAIRGLYKPKNQATGSAFRNITNKERQKRLHLIEGCVRLGMSVEQMVDYLPTVGLRLSRTTLYEYLGTMKLPRGYKTSESGQSHHDYYTYRFFIRIAQDAAAAGHRTSRLSKGTAAEGGRFRPDFTFHVSNLLHFLELQLSDLTETRWSVKVKNYVKLRKTLGRQFRALFVIDQKGDLAYARRHAREVLLREGHYRNLILFVRLDDLKGSKNVVTDPVWVNAFGEPLRLLESARCSGPNPAAHGQR